MSRGSRVLTVLYIAVALWLAYCTVRTWGDVPAWTTLAMAAASLAPVLGVVRETVIADERRAVAVLREREGRRAAWRDAAAAAVARAEGGAPGGLAGRGRRGRGPGRGGGGVLRALVDVVRERARPELRPPHLLGHHGLILRRPGGRGSTDVNSWSVPGG
ncbi:hypothetical protein [Streptomyces griseorubens]|uniref:hypothetical protein n=1 Tax=Streptomyces griseorubens TaxID=66897 RepID=UPI000B059727|nr:hypothetical protein [Streptomyces griseorubens]